MNTILVWVLITAPTNAVMTYSPPLDDLQTCEFLQKQIPTKFYSKCVQIRMVK